MNAKRTIRASDVVRDVRGGMTDTELTAKYQITEAKLAQIIDKLTAARLLAPLGTEEERPEIPAVQDPQERRRSPRCHTVVPLPVYDLDDLLTEGYVTEITEDGLQATGLDINKGDGRSLLIRPDEFADVYPFLVDVECRWTRQDEDDGLVAGFSITHITPESAEELQKLLRSVTLCDRPD
jgi:hypothetical protein